MTALTPKSRKAASSAWKRPRSLHALAKTKAPLSDTPDTSRVQMAKSIASIFAAARRVDQPSPFPHRARPDFGKDDQGEEDVADIAADAELGEAVVEDAENEDADQGGEHVWLALLAHRHAEKHRSDGVEHQAAPLRRVGRGDPARIHEAGERGAE